MDNRQKIALHKALETPIRLTRHDAARIALALELLGEQHWRLAADLESAMAHTLWAAENLAQVEAAAPKVAGDFPGFDRPVETPEVIAARQHVDRYEKEWWAVKARIDAVSTEIEQSSDLAAYVAYDEARVPS